MEIAKDLAQIISAGVKNQCLTNADEAGNTILFKALLHLRDCLTQRIVNHHEIEIALVLIRFISNNDKEDTFFSQAKEARFITNEINPLLQIIPLTNRDPKIFADINKFNSAIKEKSLTIVTDRTVAISARFEESSIVLQEDRPKSSESYFLQKEFAYEAQSKLFKALNLDRHNPNSSERNFEEDEEELARLTIIKPVARRLGPKLESDKIPPPSQ